MHIHVCICVHSNVFKCVLKNVHGHCISRFGLLPPMCVSICTRTWLSTDGLLGANPCTATHCLGYAERETCTVLKQALSFPIQATHRTHLPTRLGYPRLDGLRALAHSRQCAQAFVHQGAAAVPTPANGQAGKGAPCCCGKSTSRIKSLYACMHECCIFTCLFVGI